MGDGSRIGDALIPIINKLQDIFAQVSVDLKLALPQVAVIGSQSSGKSSVLESLVGQDFLPRGSDIVTRRPLVLQLIKSGNGPAGRPPEWGEFLHAPGKVFTDFGQIRQEIALETERLVGSNKNVSEKPIRLKIFSPRVLTMTLVDLPGLTKIAVGDQPSNIEARIRDMVLEYIRPANCIILAVSPANSDLATSDGLQMAQVVDPEGARTIGVLTKLDIMDRGTNAAHILRNTHIPLRLGYVAVINRCQDDINKSVGMDESRRAESAFFGSRSEYRDLSPHCGVGNLARRLNAILVDHIRAILPRLRRQVGDAVDSRARELRGYGDPEPLQGKSARWAPTRGGFLLQLLCDYCDRVAAMLDGRHQDLSMSELSGGARIRHVFVEVYGKGLRELSPQRDVRDDEISTVIKNGAGVSGNLLVPQEPFELLVRRAIAMLLGPALQCKDCVYEELLKIADQARPREAARFPALQRQLSAAVLEFIRDGAEPAERMIRSLLECEHDYINCDHSEFIGGRGAIRAVMHERGLRQAKRDSAEASASSSVASAATGVHAPAPVMGRLSARHQPSSYDAKANGANTPSSLPASALGLKVGAPSRPSSSAHHPTLCRCANPAASRVKSCVSGDSNTPPTWGQHRGSLGSGCPNVVWYRQQHSRTQHCAHDARSLPLQALNGCASHGANHGRAHHAGTLCVVLSRMSGARARGSQLGTRTHTPVAASIAASVTQGRPNARRPRLFTQGLPEPSVRSPDDMLGRGTRRKSEDGEADGSSHWFSWFNGRGESMHQVVASANGGGGGGGGGGGLMERKVSLDDSALLLMPTRLHLASQHRSEAEEVEVEVIRKLVDSYFGIVRKTLLDQVPKAIMHFMVNHVKRGLQQHLIRSLYRDDILDALLTEHEDVVAKRAACSEALSALQAASLALEEMPVELTSYSVVSAHGSVPDAGSLAPLYSIRLDPHPSVAVAARVAATAVASYHANGPAATNGGSWKASTTTLVGFD
ncbi:MAG: hypothetical protein WDW36_005172 [Sanguina aurantia]